MSRNNNDFLQGFYKEVDPSMGRTTYFYGGEPEDPENSPNLSGSVITVDHPKDRYQTNPALYISGYNEWYDDEWAKENADKDGNVPIWKVTRTPPVMGFTMGTDDVGFQTGSLGLHAVADTERRFGERPWGSDDTSANSTPIVNDAIVKGIIPGVIGQQRGEPVAQQTNTLDSRYAKRSVSQAHRLMRYHRDYDAETGGNTFNVQGIDPETVSQDARALTLEGIHNKREAARTAEARGRFLELPQSTPFMDQLEAFKETVKRPVGGRASALKEGIESSYPSKSTNEQLTLPGLEA